MHPYFHIFSLRIPAYGTFMALALVVGCALAWVRLRRRGGDGDTLLLVAACAVGLALLGARLLYLLVSYDAARAWAELRQGDFSCLTAEGQVFYGGLVGGIAGTLLGFRIVKERNYAIFLYAIVPCIPLGQAIGRVGCLFGGCCYGFPYAGFGAVCLAEAGVPGTVFPAQIVAAGADLLLFLALLAYAKRRPDAGFRLLYLYLAGYAVLRFGLEFLRGDLIRGVAGGLSTSQWISLGLLVVSVGLLLWARRREGTPGAGA
ncbi:MAG: prolipoprotein diacylglyceryl transferase [Oscillospiraceae bacterium]|nr:prolipoprotein diacylglyceryl transferase [Oscillospiraceae bacterium]